MFGGRGEGGECDLAEQNVGGSGRNLLKILKFSFLKSLQMHPILKTSSYIYILGAHLLLLSSLHLSIIIGGDAPPAPPLAMALMVS